MNYYPKELYERRGWTVSRRRFTTRTQTKILRAAVRTLESMEPGLVYAAQIEQVHLERFVMFSPGSRTESGPSFASFSR